MKFSLLMILMASQTLVAQWLGQIPAGTPKGRDGKPNLAAPAPRARDGRPDLSGVWHVQTTTREEWKKLLGEKELELGERTDVPGMETDTISKYGLDLFGFKFNPGSTRPEEGPMTAAGLAIFRKRFIEHTEALPSESCRPLGFPLATMLSEFFKISQAPGLTLMLMELDNGYRQIYTDGRKLPVDPQPTWYGYSVGRWQGETFVVETNGLNDKGWLDIFGHPRSEGMRMTERYRRRDFGHLDVEVSFTDPAMYSKPFSVKVTYELQPTTDVLEYICTENEKDHAHMGGK
jgi:hypothetical protein